MAFLPFMLVASLCGCGIISDLMGQGNDDDDDETPSGIVTVHTLVDEMEAGLKSRSYSATDADTIAVAADTAADTTATAKNVPATDLDELLPDAVGGGIGSFSAFTAWSEDEKLACVDDIVALFVASMKGRFDGTSLPKNSRALDAAAQAVNSILARISKAAVANLARTGIAPERRAEAASGVVGTMIESLRDGGVNKVLVNDALGKISQAAAASIAGSSAEVEAFTGAVASGASMPSTARPSSARSRRKLPRTFRRGWRKWDLPRPGSWSR